MAGNETAKNRIPRGARGPNFTANEEGLLVRLAHKFREIIEDKRIDGTSVQQKKQAWEEVTRRFNASSNGNPRSANALRDKYYNLTKRKKDGGPARKPSKDPAVSQEIRATLLEIMGNQASGRPSRYDSDRDIYQVIVVGNEFDGNTKEPPLSTPIQPLCRQGSRSDGEEDSLANAEQHVPSPSPTTDMFHSSAPSQTSSSVLANLGSVQSVEVVAQEHVPSPTTDKLHSSAPPQTSRNLLDDLGPIQCVEVVTQEHVASPTIDTLHSSAPPQTSRNSLADLGSVQCVEVVAQEHVPSPTTDTLLASAPPQTSRTATATSNWSLNDRVATPLRTVKRPKRGELKDAVIKWLHKRVTSTSMECNTSQRHAQELHDQKMKFNTEKHQLEMDILREELQMKKLQRSMMEELHNQKISRNQ